MSERAVVFWALEKGYPWNFVCPSRPLCSSRTCLEIGGLSWATRATTPPWPTRRAPPLICFYLSFPPPSHPPLHLPLHLMPPCKTLVHLIGLWCASPEWYLMAHKNLITNIKPTYIIGTMTREVRVGLYWAFNLKDQVSSKAKYVHPFDQYIIALAMWET